MALLHPNNDLNYMYRIRHRSFAVLHIIEVFHHPFVDSTLLYVRLLLLFLILFTCLFLSVFTFQVFVNTIRFNPIRLVHFMNSRCFDLFFTGRAGWNAVSAFDFSLNAIEIQWAEEITYTQKEKDLNDEKSGYVLFLFGFVSVSSERPSSNNVHSQRWWFAFFSIRTNGFNKCKAKQIYIYI